MGSRSHVLSFRGITRLTIDNKGRVALPKHQRDRLEQGGVTELVISLDPDRCLVVYPAPLFYDLERQIMALSKSYPYNKMLQQTMVAFATPFELDSAGRMLLPADLRAEAGLDKKVVLIGQGKRLELWDERSWVDVSASWDETRKSTPADELPPGVADIEF